MRCVYGIWVLPSRKFVVGSSVSHEDRWRVHRRALRAGNHWNHKLQNAYRKYGPQNIAFTVLELVPENEDPLTHEQWWITSLWDSGRLLNESREVCRFPKFHELPRHKQKRIVESLRVSFKLRPPEEQERLRRAYANGKVGAANPAKREDVKRRISESLTGSKNYWFGRNRPAHQQGMRGKKHSPETLLKMREARQNWWKQNGDAMVGRRKHSPETLVKMREARKAWWAERKRQTA